MITFDNYSTHTYRTCPNCGYVQTNLSCDSYSYIRTEIYKEPEPEPEILQHDHPKLCQKQIGSLLQFYALPLYNRKLLFCASGYLPKRIKRIRKSK